MSLISRHLIRAAVWPLVWAVVWCIGCAAPTPKGLNVTYHYTTTDDGITLALRRYLPQRPALDKNPVILCHGLSYNMMFWDLAENISLPRYLARRGYDVWALSLRGACPSSQPLSSSFRKLGHFNLDPEMFKTFQARLKDIKMNNWSVDDHVNHDVPAAIDFVCSRTGRDRVHWVGHSMGGMIMFAYLGQAERPATAKVKSFVALAVPMAVFYPRSGPMNFLLEQQAALSVGSAVVGSSAPAAMGVFFGDMGTELDRLFYNGTNIDQANLRELFHVAQEEISPSQLQQLLDMVRTERFHSLDGSVDYTATLESVTTPVCFLVGTVDNLATPGAVRYAYRTMVGTDREFHLFGRVNAHQNDYGHDDIVIGAHARQEVYPVVLKWLRSHPRTPHETPLMLQPETTGP